MYIDCRIKIINKMQQSKNNLAHLYSKADALFLELSAYFKKMMHDHHKNQGLTVDQKKILKLFSYIGWQQYMNWIDQKLQETGQTNQDKQPLSQIIEQSPDLQQSISQAIQTKRQIDLQLPGKRQRLAIENAKLRKQNSKLAQSVERMKRELKQLYKSDRL